MGGRKTDLGSLYILIACAKPHVVQVLRHVLTISGVQHIQIATCAEVALEVLSCARISAVFCDDSCGEIGGKSFAHAVRRDVAVLNPMLPLFLVCAGPRQRDVELARDTGYTDVLTRPVSAATVARKLKHVLENPRSFIAAPDFFGPDRRSGKRPAFRGDERRRRAARKVKMGAPAPVPAPVRDSNIVEI